MSVMTTTSKLHPLAQSIGYTGYNTVCNKLCAASAKGGGKSCKSLCLLQRTIHSYYDDKFRETGEFTTAQSKRKRRKAKERKGKARGEAKESRGIEEEATGVTGEVTG